MTKNLFQESIEDSLLYNNPNALMTNALSSDKTTNRILRLYQKLLYCETNRKLLFSFCMKAIDCKQINNAIA
jgi:hypothetical protein